MPSCPWRSRFLKPLDGFSPMNALIGSIQAAIPLDRRVVSSGVALGLALEKG